MKSPGLPGLFFEFEPASVRIMWPICIAAVLLVQEKIACVHGLVMRLRAMLSTHNRKGASDNKKQMSNIGLNSAGNLIVSYRHTSTASRNRTADARARAWG